MSTPNPPVSNSTLTHKVDTQTEWIVFAFDLEHIAHSKRSGFIHKLYGRRQIRRLKSGSKTYYYPGLLARLGGEKLNASVFQVPKEHEEAVLAFFREYPEAKLIRIEASSVEVVVLGG